MLFRPPSYLAAMRSKGPPRNASRCHPPEKATRREGRQGVCHSGDQKGDTPEARHERVQHSRRRGDGRGRTAEGGGSRGRAPVAAAAAPARSSETVVPRDADTGAVSCRQACCREIPLPSLRVSFQFSLQQFSLDLLLPPPCETDAPRLSKSCQRYLLTLVVNASTGSGFSAILLKGRLGY